MFISYEAKVIIPLVAGCAFLFGVAESVLADHSQWHTNGAAVYETTCIACHGANGKGEIPGVPDFTKKNGPLAKSDEELFTNIKDGFESPGSFMAMPALGGNPDLTDQDIRDVIEYLRKEFEKK